MMRALYTAATGMISEQTNVDTIANNLANVNTTGFKAERTEFKSLLYQTLQTKTTTANGESKPIGAQVGLGTRVASTTSMYTQGIMNASDSDTDFAIEGDGFFAVRGQDQKVYYTRNGHFNWSLDGQGGSMLTTADGLPVLDEAGQPIRVPEGVLAENMIVNDDGRIGYEKIERIPVYDEDGVTVKRYEVKSENVLTDQYMAMYQFSNPAGLEKASSSRLVATDASGEALLERQTPGIRTSKVFSGYLEGSNVQVADEMVNLIIAQRAYEMNSKAITTADSMLETANNLKR